MQGSIAVGTHHHPNGPLTGRIHEDPIELDDVQSEGYYVKNMHAYEASNGAHFVACALSSRYLKSREMAAIWDLDSGRQLGRFDDAEGDSITAITAFACASATYLAVWQAALYHATSPTAGWLSPQSKAHTRPFLAITAMHTPERSLLLPPQAEIAP